MASVGLLRLILHAKTSDDEHSRGGSLQPESQIRGAGYESQMIATKQPPPPETGEVSQRYLPMAFGMRLW